MAEKKTAAPKVANEPVYTAEEFWESAAVFAKKLDTSIDVVMAAMAEKKLVSATVPEFEKVVKEFKEREVK